LRGPAGIPLNFERRQAVPAAPNIDAAVSSGPLLFFGLFTSAFAHLTPPVETEAFMFPPPYTTFDPQTVAVLTLPMTTQLRRSRLLLTRASPNTLSSWRPRVSAIPTSCAWVRLLCPSVGLDLSADGAAAGLILSSRVGYRTDAADEMCLDSRHGIIQQQGG